MVDTATTEVNLDKLESQLGDMIWGDEPKPTATTIAEPAKPAPVDPLKKEDTPAFDPREFVKKEFGMDDMESVKQLIEKGKNYKEQPALKFENTESETAYNYLTQGKKKELRELLNKQAELEDAVNLSPAEAIKLQIKHANPHYKAVDVEDVYKEKYSVPREPKQTLDETEAEFAERHSAWKEQADFVQRKIERDSFSAKQDLQKLQSQIILPDITPKNNAKTPEQQQKELDTAKGLRQLFEQTLEKDYASFNGYNEVYKNKDVEIPVSYAITPEEQTVLKSEVLNFNFPEYFNTRWFDKDGKPNIKQLMDDYYLLQNKAKVFQKLVSESVNKTLDHQIKGTKNIHLDGNRQPAAVINSDEELRKKEEFIWGA